MKKIPIGNYCRFGLYPSKLKNWLFDRAKAPGFDDRKGGQYCLIRPPLRSSNRGSFRIGRKADFSVYLGIIFLFIFGLSFFGYHKIYKKRTRTRDFLITGCARSGTGYISNLLQQCGLEIGHEKTLRDGVSSWMMCINAKRVPWAVDSRKRLRFKHIFHQVRHPLKVISSVQTEGRPSWKYIIKHIPEIHWEDPMIVKCAKYWYYWNLKAEEQAEWTYRIEEIEQVWDEFCRRSGKKLDRTKLEGVPRNFNGRSHTDLTWEDLEKQLDPDLYQKIRLLAEKYGYAVEEAQ